MGRIYIPVGFLATPYGSILVRPRHCRLLPCVSRYGRLHIEFFAGRQVHARVEDAVVRSGRALLDQTLVRAVDTQDIILNVDGGAHDDDFGRFYS